MPIYEETTLSSNGIGKRLLSAASFFSRDLYSSSDDDCCFDFDGDASYALDIPYTSTSDSSDKIIRHPNAPAKTSFSDIEIPDFFCIREKEPKTSNEDIEDTIKRLDSKKVPECAITNSYVKVLQNKVEQLYISAKSTLTYLLYAIYYLSIKDRCFDLPQFI